MFEMSGVAFFHMCENLGGGGRLNELFPFCTFLKSRGHLVCRDAPLVFSKNQSTVAQQGDTTMDEGSLTSCF